jgi:hypothetical protein
VAKVLPMFAMWNTRPTPIQAIGRGEADFSTAEATYVIQGIVGGSSVVVLAGIHVG